MDAGMTSSSRLHRATAWLMGAAYAPTRGLLFSLDAESAHHVTLRGLRIAARCGLNALAGPPPEANPVTLWGLRFPNRVGLAAGMDKAGDCVDGLGALGFGFVEIGTLTPRPQPGNPQPRLFRIVEREAIINRMGFNNPGIEQGLSNAAGRRYRGVLGINLGKNFDTPNELAVDDYVKGLQAAYSAADYVTVNLSSPNTKGLRDLQQADSVRGLIRALHAAREPLAQQHGKQVPVLIKIAPDLEPEALKEMADVFVTEKLDGVIATNTTVSRAGVEGLRHGGETGGLSGAPLTEKAEKLLQHLLSALRGSMPVIASGGIMTAGDAASRLSAGAALVQLYTGLIYRGPRLVRECVEACGRAG